MHREGRRLDVGQTPDTVPGLFSVFVLQIADKIVEDEAVHLRTERDQRLTRSRCVVAGDDSVIRFGQIFKILGRL